MAAKKAGLKKSGAKNGGFSSKSLQGKPLMLHTDAGRTFQWCAG